MRLKAFRRYKRLYIVIAFLVMQAIVAAFFSTPCSAYNDEWTALAAPAYEDWTLNLRGVWGSGPNNVFAAGFFFDNLKYYPEQPIILHYDGYEVVEMTLPDPYDKYIGRIWGSSGSNVYVVGQENPSYGVYTTPYMLHYNGSSWQEVTSLPSIGDTLLYSVWGSSANDIFVGGKGHILHYDGTTWTDMTIPAMTPEPMFYGMWGTSSSDVWATGRQYDGSAFPYETGVILHYDGTSWTEIAGSQIYSMNVTSVWGTSSSDVYFCGYSERSYGSDNEIPRIFHWDGTSLTEMYVPDLQTDSYGNAKGRLWDIWGTSGSNIYAIGAWTILHYDGSSWTQALDSDGLSGWSYSQVYQFKGGWDLAKLGQNVGTTAGTTVKVATSTGEFTYVVNVDPATIVDQNNRPESLPYGLFDYSIPVPAYDRVRITFQFPGELGSDIKWFKYDPTKGWFSYENAYFDTVLDERGTTHTIAWVYIWDNGEGDSDPRPGYINDPSGPGNEGGGVGGGGGGCFLSTAR